MTEDYLPEKSKILNWKAKWINEFKKVAGYKNIQKATAFLYYNSNSLENKVKKSLF